MGYRGKTKTGQFWTLTTKFGASEVDEDGQFKVKVFNINHEARWLGKTFKGEDIDEEFTKLMTQ